MAKYLYNTTEEEKVYVGKSVAAESYYSIPSNMEVSFSISSSLLVDIASGDIIVSKIDNSSGHITNINDAIDYIKGNLPSLVKSSNQPFADKVLPNGKKLYTRVHGVSASVSGTPDNIDFVIPYDNCKLTGIEILNGLVGDTCNLKVLDTPTGTISGVANYMLNQFGFDVNVNKDFYKRESAYDADLRKDMKIRIEYESIAALPANVFVNFILHEVKD